MTCHFCNQQTARKFGKYGKKRVQRYRCADCGKTFSDDPVKLDGMLVPQETALRIAHMLVEGVGINSIARLVGVHKKTVLNVLEIAGKRAQRVMDEEIRDVQVWRIEADELWTFVQKKQKRIREHEDDRQIGDQYTYVAMDRASKLVLSYVVGKRNAENAMSLMVDLESRLHGRPQITTDGFAPYLEAVETAFGMDVDFAQLIKIYAGGDREHRYSPSECIGAVPKPVIGNPMPRLICTLHIERQNLTMRTFIRRMTRLCLGFSKKLENLKYAVALHFAHYNFCRIHGSLKVNVCQS